MSEEHRALGEVVRAFVDRHQVVAAARQTLEIPGGRPAFWNDLGAVGWLGLHLPEAYGGSDSGLDTLAVVVEELGRAVAPGPFLPTVWASAVIAAAGSPAQQARWLPALADGSLVGAVDSRTRQSGDPVLDGETSTVMSAGEAGIFLLPVGEDVVVLDRDEVDVVVPANLDTTRPVGLVSCDNLAIKQDRVLAGARRTAIGIGRTLATAEASGIAHACVQAATDYAKQRVQFDCVIGTFQAVKHRIADMFVSAELITAASWDTSRAFTATDDEFELASAVAAAVALSGVVSVTESNIQVHGGVGFTWEHDAHLFLRRAGALAMGFGPIGHAELAVSRLTRRGVKRRRDIELPPEAEARRDEVKEFRSKLTAVPKEEQLALLLDSGYGLPHWPKPWGRAADAAEQLVIDQELMGIPRPSYGIGEWLILTLVQHGTEEQVTRWVRPSLDGDIMWCQLFSEPEAGSDAAAIRTSAERVEGGWRITGQKIWTSNAQSSTHGLATVRTDPHAAKHRGITAMVIDLTAEGVEIRPIREVTGHSAFCEVFLDNVFIPDGDVVGTIGGGWRVARSTLGNERVSIGGGGMDAAGACVELRALLDEYANDQAAQERIGALLAEEHATAMLGLRSAARAVGGGEPGPEGNITKLLVAEREQKVCDLALRLASIDSAALGGSLEVAEALLFVRCLTIAGGTSEIVRNQIAERILGLPRDPLRNG